MRFWFRFVAPRESRLQTRDDAEDYLRSAVVPALDKFVSEDAFERVCQDWAFGNFEGVVEVGRWWGPLRVREDGKVRSRQFEADVVAIGEAGEVVALGSCKWAGADNTDRRHPTEELTKLERIRLELDAPEAKLCFFDRLGFSPRLEQLAEARSDVLLVPTAGMF